MGLLTACGFRPQGKLKLAPALSTVYLESADPYGYLERMLRQYLKMSHAHLVAKPELATTVLKIISDEATQEFLSVSSTNQTRQYNLRVRVIFQLTDPQGRAIIVPQTIEETRSITIQSNQILGNSNQTTLFYQQMRRSIAYAIMNRIASKEVTQAILTYSPPKLTNPT